MTQAWKRHWETTNAGGFFVERTDGINENNTNYAKLTGNITLYNGRLRYEKRA